MSRKLIQYPEDFFDLCYFGTDTKIKLGDHIIYEKWFGLKKINSRVCYVPGVSPPHYEMEYTEDSAMWAIECGKHDIISMLYVLNDKYITRRIKFVKRVVDNYSGMRGNEKLQ